VTVSSAPATASQRPAPESGMADCLSAVESAEEIFARSSALEVITAAVDAVVIGRAAARILGEHARGGGPVPTMGGLWLAPSWAWYDGAELYGHARTRRLQPRRVVWAGGPVVLVPAGEPARMPASALQAAWSEPGPALRAGMTQVVLRLIPHARRSAVDSGVRTAPGPTHTTGLPTEVVAQPVTGGQMLHVLQGLAERGHEVGWRFLLWVERFVDRELPRANVAVGMEIREHLTQAGTVVELRPGTGAVDETTLETIKHRLMFGQGQRRGRIQSLVERAYADSTFAAVDPVSWLRRGISRDCNQMIRSAVGDPRQGRRIRAAHALGYPVAAISDQIGVTPATVEKALSPGGDASSRAIGLLRYGEDGELARDYADQVAQDEATPEDIVEAHERVREALRHIREAIRSLGGSWDEGRPVLSPRSVDIDGYREAADRLRQILDLGGAAPYLYLRSLGISRGGSR